MFCSTVKAMEALAKYAGSSSDKLSNSAVTPEMIWLSGRDATVTSCVAVMKSPKLVVALILMVNLPLLVPEGRVVRRILEDWETPRSITLFLLSI